MRLVNNSGYPEMYKLFISIEYSRISLWPQRGTKIIYICRTWLNERKNTALQDLVLQDVRTKG